MEQSHRQGNGLMRFCFTAQCTLVQSAVLRSHVVRLSVCLSVTPMDCDHTCWKSWKLIAQTISPTPSLFAANRRSTYSQGNMGKFWGDKKWGGKMAFWGTKAAISLKRVKMEENLLWRAYRNSPTLFRTVPFPTPIVSPSSRLGGLQLSYPSYLRNGQSYGLQIL